jgi:lipoprotein NlpD
MKLLLTILIASLMLASCAGNQAPVGQRGPGWYTVKTSDTLYAIAWRYGLEYEQLAQWNNIGDNEPIFPGQRLRLVKPHNASTPATSTQATLPGAVDKRPDSIASSKSSTRSSGNTSLSSNPSKWIWPTTGKPMNTFLANKLDRRGIEIAGKPGQAVVAMADGKVVYSGNGLAGYGNLIIIKHSETYLSAYAYCQERLVQEGMSVKAGKQIATMGQKDNLVKLYFEIRRNGKPVDPLMYLPKQ